MNPTQRIIVLTGAVAIAILFHTYFCDWRRGADGYALLFYTGERKSCC